MSYPKMVKLISTLAAKTEQGSIGWVETEVVDVFQMAFPNNFVRLSFEEKGPFGQLEYQLQILNNEGNVIEEINNAQLSGFIADSYEVMGKLYNNARRQAMGVDTALDEILAFIEPNPFL
ncbi:hypothetical protein [Pseudomonas sp. L1(2025)]|uniref:hypothetical protein n=1 Tax=Pseudomonas sp. L1(2025) TaxID=3449429 RepID=UPI003F691FC8